MTSSNDPRYSDALLAFDHAPVGLLVSRQRVIQSYNEAFREMFGHAPAALAGQSLACLYPSQAEYEHIGDRALLSMKDIGTYSDERIMRKADGQLFWCRVSGRAVERGDPFAAAAWVFEDLSRQRPVGVALTPREREIAQFLVAGKTSKEIGKALGLGYRTVEAHRARLMRKMQVGTAQALVARLLGQA